MLVGCPSLNSDCPTYKAEGTVVNLPDSKRFSRSGLGGVQQDVFEPDTERLATLMVKSFTSSNLKTVESR